MASYLAEIPEPEAAGPVAEIYADIRGVLGLPLVNLVYRHLAVEPSRLEAAWRELRPNLTDEAIDASAESLVAKAAVNVPALSPSALRTVGVDPPALAGVAATLDAYNHANPRNLLALRALLHGATGGGEARPTTRPPVPQRLVPMADLDRLDDATRTLLEEMAASVAAKGEEALVPGLFRHLAHYPGLLALAWTALRPAVNGRAVARQANAVSRDAAARATALPHPVEATRDPQTKAVLRRFTETIPRMIVVGVALRHSLDEALAVGNP